MLDFVVLSTSPRFYEYIQTNVIVALASKKHDDDWQRGTQ
jgi:hypothetical protein